MFKQNGKRDVLIVWECQVKSGVFAEWVAEFLEYSK